MSSLKHILDRAADNLRRISTAHEISSDIQNHIICSVHFETDTFPHNDHDGYVQFSTNLTQKRLLYQSGRLIFINIRPPVVHPPYYLSYDCSYIPMYEIYSWKRFINDRKISVTILCIGSTFGNIYSKYAIVYCGYHFSFDYVCSSAIMHMCDFWCQNIYQKWSGICIKWYLSHKQATLCCVAEFKQTRGISNIRQTEFESL